MAWSKPKKVVTNTLVLLSLVSILLTVIAVVTTLVWMENPKLINKIDLKIPNFYENKVESLYEKIKNEKTTDGKYPYYQELNEYLNNISSLDRYYKQKQDVYKFLIQYYLSKNEKKKALAIANTWVKQNDYDYEAKLYYVDILAQISEPLASKYYHTLYSKHKDILEIAKQHISFLVKNKQLDKAITIENEFNENHINIVNAHFKMYYLDANNSKYSEKTSINIQKYTRLQNDIIELQVSKDFNLLSGIRFDINNAPVGSTIENLTIDIQTENRNYKNITFKPVHHLKPINTSLHETTGNDPFYYLDLPTKLQSYQGNIKIIINLVLKNQINIAKNTIQMDNSNENIKTKN